MATMMPQAVPTPEDRSSLSTPLSWEGDRMFNIYIYDYCYKRGFRKTARELLAEADIPLESQPPINARQGLLFEWWSVFWVLFTAKSSGNGTEEAMLYTQHQAQQAAQRQRMQSQVPLNRFMNGIPRQPGLIPNGVGASHGQMQPSFPMTAPVQQTNGIPGSVGPPSVPGAPQAPFQPMVPGQRPPQQRVPNGMPFQSPTMAHSPTGGPPQHGQAPMNPLGPSPHLAHMTRGGMLPPNNMQVMNHQGAIPPAQGSTPTQTFQQIGRPGSAPATDGQSNMMTQPSPSLTSRQAPGALQPGDIRESTINNELNRLGPTALLAYKQEAGLGEKDFQACTLEEKQRIWAVAKARAARDVKPGLSSGNNSVAGPSGSNASMPLTQRHQQPTPMQQPRGHKRSGTTPGEDHHPLVPKAEASPPDRKRVRRSPMGMEQTPLASVAYPPSQQGGPALPPQIPNGMMKAPLTGQPISGGFQHQPGMQNMGNMPIGHMGAPPMGNAMSPGMTHPVPGPGAMMLTPQQQQQIREAHYRHTMHHAMHKNNIPPGVLNSALSNAGSPSSSDPSFNPSGPQGQGAQFSAGATPNPRVNQNKPMAMMPPPSPATNTTSKDSSGPNKDTKGGNSNAANGNPEGSPQNAANTGQPGQATTNTGTAPATPVPGANQNMTAPSPSSILSNPSSMNQPPQSATSAQDPMNPNFFASDFMQSVNALDDFDPSIFRTDGDLNFERDFREWFNPDDVSPLDLK